MNRCYNCIHWVFSYVDGIDKFGKCNNSLVLDDVRIVREDNVEDLFTNANFGCVWHEEKVLSLADIKEATKKFVEEVMPEQQLIICKVCKTQNYISNDVCWKCKSQL